MEQTVSTNIENKNPPALLQPPCPGSAPSGGDHPLTLEPHDYSYIISDVLCCCVIWFVTDALYCMSLPLLLIVTQLWETSGCSASSYMNQFMHIGIQYLLYKLDSVDCSCSITLFQAEILKKAFILKLLFLELFSVKNTAVSQTMTTCIGDP